MFLTDEERQTMIINIDETTAEAILILDERYIFELYQAICKDEEEEYLFRNAINYIAEEIKRKTK